jgi:prepilin-type N-terminal cleavage/methylation domain-containing protein
MKLRAGFTIVELIITMTIMVILITLSTATLSSNLARGRDQERKTDVANILIFQESAYNRNNGSYFPDSSLNSPAVIDVYYANIDKNNLRAPGVVSPNYSLVKATNTVQTAAGVLPQPTNTTYVYQVLTSAGGLCSTTGSCRKFNMYYLEESTNTTQMVTSRSQ